MKLWLYYDTYLAVTRKDHRFLSEVGHHQMTPLKGPRQSEIVAFVRTTDIKADH